jgi:hypothetical protein
MDPSWFAGEGWMAVAVAAFALLVAGGTMLWLRGPGRQPHDPPVAHDAVRWFAASFAFLGVLWLVRAVAGVGGFLVAVGVVLVACLAYAVRARLRHT